MAINQYLDRVKQPAIVSGTGGYVFSNASTLMGYRTFQDVVGGVYGVPYCAEHGANWEVGEGTFDWGANTLNRTLVICTNQSGDGVLLPWGTDEVVTVSLVHHARSIQNATNAGIIIPKYGPLSVANGTFRFYPPQEMFLRHLDAWVGTPAAGQDIKFTVKKGTYSLATGIIAAGAYKMTSQTLPVFSINPNVWLAINITQVGTTTAGTDLCVRFM
ncbi:MAG: hypothetical protein HQL76_06320 [Magnetococcales bacterium]|nr:hypothetical protein [Magnetococcales bacterium]